MQYPKCGIDGCGSKRFRKIGTIQGKKTLIMYQCTAGHVHLRYTEIEKSENPMEVLKDEGC